MRRARILLAVGLLSALPAAAEAPPARRMVVIAVDAVPHSIMLEVMAPEEEGGDGAFTDLKGPVPLISTFPSTTSIGLPAILRPFGLDLSAGYEAKYFDWHENRIVGGGLVSYGKVKFPWREFFDWETKGLFKKMTTTLRPIKATANAIAKSLEAFMASDDDVFFVYYYTTDPAGHLRGPQVLRPIMVELDRVLKRTRAAHPDRPFTTVVFSDHGQAGGPPLRNVRDAVERQIRLAGLKRHERLKTDDSVVLVPFGLVSSLVAYTRPGTTRRAAEAIAAAKGVDVCAIREDDGWLLLDAAGAARIDRRGDADAAMWSYEPRGSDPLDLVPAVAARGEKLTWHDDQWWFDLTAESDYPDALFRIAQGFELVDNPASILCSTAGEFMYGAAMTTFGSRLSSGRLRWTHGSLLREATMGFLISDDPGWEPPAAARYSEALMPFVESARKAAMAASE